MSRRLSLTLWHPARTRLLTTQSGGSRGRWVAPRWGVYSATISLPLVCLSLGYKHPKDRYLHLSIAKRSRRYRFRFRVPAWLATAWQHQRALLLAVDWDERMLRLKRKWNCKISCPSPSQNSTNNPARQLGDALRWTSNYPFVTINVWKFSDKENSVD